MQFGSVGRDAVRQLGRGPRRVDDPERLRDTGGVGDVAVAAVGIQGLCAVELVGPQETVDLGDVHPLEQVGIRGGIRCAVRGHAVHAAVERFLP